MPSLTVLIESKAAARLYKKFATKISVVMLTLSQRWKGAAATIVPTPDHVSKQTKPNNFR
jgi:hypothetical protein